MNWITYAAGLALAAAGLLLPNILLTLTGLFLLVFALLVVTGRAD